MKAPGLHQHAGIARHDKVPGLGHLHDHHHARDMSNKRNHGDESNRVPYIEQPRKLVCNKMTPADKAEKHMHPPRRTPRPRRLSSASAVLICPTQADATTVPSLGGRRPDPPGPRRIPPLRCLPLVGTSLSHPTLEEHRDRTVCPPVGTTTALSVRGERLASLRCIA